MAVSPPINLGAARVERSDNALDWTPLDLLRATLREWEAHPELVPAKALLITVAPGQDHWRVRYTAANLTFAEHLALLVIGQHERMAECERE